MPEDEKEPIISSHAVVQFINYLLHYETITPIIENSMDASFFPGYEKEFNFIVDFYNKSKLYDGKGKVPDLVRFIKEFPEFSLYKPVDSGNMLYRELLEQKCYSHLVEVFQKGSKMAVEGTSFDTIAFVKAETDKLYNFANRTLGQGTDLIKGANERLEEYIERIKREGLLGISCGDPEFDKILLGWLPEDLIILMARTNQGKSWILLYYLLQAILSGKKAALYSGEMGNLMMGFRFDTMYKHFSNLGLISGDSMLGSDDKDIGPKTMKEYTDYIHALITGDLPELRVFTQRDLGGRLTVNKMRVLQERHNFSIWGADQLSLMEDDKKSGEERIRFGNITADARIFTQDYQIPVLIAHQASRKAAEAKKKDPNATPEMEDSFGADAIMQNATRGISFTQVENGAKLKLIKNTYGTNGSEFFYVWNINFGIYIPMNRASIKDNLF